MIGTTELIVIGGAILLLFGGKKIPGLMKSMGQGVKSFKEGLREDTSAKNANEQQAHTEPEPANEAERNNVEHSDTKTDKG